MDARQALLETARFYGILVPTEEGWEFVHRTVHDFLAASYWVETGEFAAVRRHKWTARTAYAACRIPDATEIFKAALRAPDGLPVAAEMLSNGAPMSAKVVANALQSYFSVVGLASTQVVPGSRAIVASLSTDFVRGANSRLLDRLVEAYSSGRTKVTDALLTYCLVELKERGLKLDYVTYQALKTGYHSEDVVFQIPRQGSVGLREMDPAT